MVKYEVKNVNYPLKIHGKCQLYIKTKNMLCASNVFSHSVTHSLYET